MFIFSVLTSFFIDFKISLQIKTLLFKFVYFQCFDKFFQKVQCFPSNDKFVYFQRFDEFFPSISISFQHVDVVSDDDDEDDDDIVALTPIGESNKLASLEKMVWLLVVLVEKSRGEDNQIHLSNSDIISLTGKAVPSAATTTATAAAAASSSSTSTTSSQPTPTPPPPPTSSSRGLVFLYNITKDNINICQTGNLIFALARNNQEFAESVAAMVFQGVKQTEYYMNFFRLLTLLTELPGAGGPPGMPCFTSLVMHKVWELAKTCPQPALDWLSIQVARNR